MLVPDKLKGLVVKKFYDFAAHYEMNRLHDVGVNGVRLLMLGTTLDTPGRRELLNMQSVNAFYPCPYCLHTWAPGLRRQVYAGYRRFLPENSPWRRGRFRYKGCTYWFRGGTETKPRPMSRTDRTVREMLCMARASRRPFCGHKGPPLLQSWRTDWGRSCADWMHDLKCMTGMLLSALVGDVFEYKWNKDASHRKDCKAYNLFPGFQNGGPPPWRLSRQEVKLLDLLVRTMMLPRYTDPLHHHQHSFFTHPDRVWKARHKLYVFLVLLPTCLHFTSVRAVHHALLVLVDALRHLDGQTISIAEAIRRGVEPGERVLEHTRVLLQWEEQLIRGLVLLEGSFPIDHLNPALHHLTHYPMIVFRFGVLLWFSMFSFERNNKRLKKLVRNMQRPEASLAKNVELDIATRFLSCAQKDKCEGFLQTRPPFCVLKPLNQENLYIPSRAERFELGMLGITSLAYVLTFPIAWILGVHFRAGEWGGRRCGSVITCIHDGRSRYCVVKSFLRVQGKSFARVEWLSVPTYPYAPNKLVVRVSMLTDAEQEAHVPVIPIEIIEPTSVAVIRDRDGIHYFMMREKGTDRTGVRR